MSKYVLRYYEWNPIRALLKEIGDYEYSKNLERMKLPRHINKDFYLEANEHCIFLCYTYPSRVSFKIMKVDGYDNLPKEGWVLEKEH